MFIFEFLICANLRNLRFKNAVSIKKPITKWCTILPAKMALIMPFPAFWIVKLINQPDPDFVPLDVGIGIVGGVDGAEGEALSQVKVDGRGVATMRIQEYGTEAFVGCVSVRRFSW